MTIRYIDQMKAYFEVFEKVVILIMFCRYEYIINCDSNSFTSYNKHIVFLTMSLWYTSDWIHKNLPVLSNRQEKGVRSFTWHLPLQPGVL